MPKEIKCNKCDGTGILKEFMHVNGGVCFECSGTGTAIQKPESKSKGWKVDESLSRHELKVIDYLRKPLNFGKYKGKALFEIDQMDHEYMEWLNKFAQDKRNYAMHEAVNIIMYQEIEKFESLKKRYKKENAK